MGVYLDDVTYWVHVWATTGDLVSEAVARRIADYWQSSAETGALARFALGAAEPTDVLLEDIASTIRYVKGIFDTVELEALKAWVLTQA